MPVRCAMIGLCAWAGAAAAQPTRSSCVDVQVGSAQSYDCINQKLQAEARAAQRSPGGDVPYSAQSPGNVTGQFNEDATRDRLGANFGKSATPARPPSSLPGAFAAPK